MSPGVLKSTPCCRRRRLPELLNHRLLIHLIPPLTFAFSTFTILPASTIYFALTLPKLASTTRMLASSAFLPICRIHPTVTYVQFPRAETGISEVDYEKLSFAEVVLFDHDISQCAVVVLDVVGGED